MRNTLFFAFSFSSILSLNALADEPCDAVYFELDQCLVVSNVGAGTSAFNAGCANYQGSDIWFKVVVPASGSFSVQTNSTGGLNDTALGLWSGTCSNLQQEDCDDDSGTGYFSYLTISNQTPGDTMYLQCWGYGGATGEFELCINAIDLVDLQVSELPIVVINTAGQEIPDEPKIDASMQIIYNGPGTLTSINDTNYEYNGDIGIERRGASSQGYPQRPFALETRNPDGSNNNVSILEMPSENDWVLLSHYNEKSFCRTLISQHIFEEMGGYMPRVTLCEVIINGQYEGIYTFGEKLKKDNNRVDIATLRPDENAGDSLTGGYILQLNYWNSNNSFESNYSPMDHPGFDVHFVYEYPKPDVISPQQKTYIAAYVDSMETALYGADFDDPLEGYRKYLDTPSFIDYFILNEVSRNNDGFKKSRFFYKDKNSNGGKLKAGPPWDFDWAWKNINACLFANTDGSGWAHHINDCPTDNYSPGWYIKLLQDSLFHHDLRCRYNELRESVLATDHLHSYIDSIASLVENANQRHFQKWPFLGINTGAPEVGPIPTTFQGEVDYLKDWIEIRLNWLDGELPEPAECDTISTVTIDDEVSNSFRVYPNPSNGKFVIDLNTISGATFLEVFAISGQRILSKQVTNSDQVIDLTGFAEGVYQLRVIASDVVYGQRLILR